MKLFISGKEGSSLKKEMPPTLLKAKKFLDESKDGELFFSQQLSRILGVSSMYFAHSCSAGFLKEYTYRVRQQRYWGKPVTINQLKKETK